MDENNDDNAHGVDNEIVQMIINEIVNINNTMNNTINDTSNNEAEYYNNVFNNTFHMLINDLNYYNNFNLNDNSNLNNYYNPINTFYGNTSNSSQNILNESLYDRNPIKHVITEDVRSSLIPIKFKDAKDKENNEDCSITMDALKEEDDIIQLPCNHCFLVEPIMKWLTEESCECPICRYKFDSVEKNTRNNNETDEVDDLPELIPISEYVNSPPLISNNIFSSYYNAGYNVDYEYQHDYIIGPPDIEESDAESEYDSEYDSDIISDLGVD